MQEIEEDFEEGSTQELSESVIYLSGEISSDTVTPAIGAIVEANINRNVPSIVLMIQSPGGNLDEGFALASCIEASEIPIITVAIGKCDSSALIIAMTGDKRFVAESCSILSHQYSAGVGMSKHTDLLERIKDLNMTADRVIDHYVKHTKLDRKDVKKKLVNEKDVFLSAEEAISLNLFDDFFVSFDQILTYPQNEILKESDNETI